MGVRVVQTCEAGRCVLADFPVWKCLLRPIAPTLTLPYRHSDRYRVVPSGLQQSGSR